jgi:hypothetical protein
MLTIPPDLDRLHPDEISAWLDGLVDDDTLTDQDWTAAQYAAAVALGVPDAVPAPGSTAAHPGLAIPMTAQPGRRVARPCRSGAAVG